MKIKILFLVFCVLCFSSGYSQSNIEQLFNGKDLSNWNFIVKDNAVLAKDVYSIKNGVIHIQGDPIGYMYTTEKYGNCHLHAEWRWIKEASNSGIFILIDEAKNPFPNGIECQLQAGNAGDFVLLGGSDLVEFEMPLDGIRPNFPIVKKANVSSEKPVGEWNYADIYIYDGVITVYINGIYQNTGTNKVKKGHIGLQSEGKEVEFKNITVAPIR